MTEDRKEPNWDNHSEVLLKAEELGFRLKSMAGCKTAFTQIDKPFGAYEFDCLSDLKNFLKSRIAIKEMVSVTSSGGLHEFDAQMMINAMRDVLTFLTSAIEGIYYFLEIGMDYDEQSKNATLSKLEDGIVILIQLRAFLRFKDLANKTELKEYYTYLQDKRPVEAFRLIERVARRNDDSQITIINETKETEVHDE
jgi:hypothetical protein